MICYWAVYKRFLRVRLINKKAYRFLRIAIYLVILAGLMYYGRFYNPTLTLNDCLQQPEKYDGAYLELANELTVRAVYPDSFLIHQAGHIVKVVGHAPAIGVNDFIALKAVFHKAGWLELVGVRVAEQRRAKIWISVLPVLLVLYLFFRQFRFNVAGFYFERRH